jgi:hypothetical protein
VLDSDNQDCAERLHPIGIRIDRRKLPAFVIHNIAPQYDFLAIRFITFQREYADAHPQNKQD